MLCSFALMFGQLASAAMPPDSGQKKAVGDIPPFLIGGMDAYKATGPDDAVKAWIKGSPVEGSKDALSQANLLRQVQDFYGAYRNFDVVSARELSTSTRIIYVILNYDKGPLFAKFVIYRAEQGWILTSFNFNTKDEMIPSSLP
jgi:hypothetical protein